MVRGMTSKIEEVDDELDSMRKIMASLKEGVGVVKKRDEVFVKKMMIL